MQSLASRWRVLAPDLYGYAKDTPRDRLADFRLSDEIDWLMPIFDRAGERFHLVGHSYGGTVSLLAALQFPERVRSVALFEPAVWSVLVQSNAAHPGAVEIATLRSQTVSSVEAGDLDGAAENFVRYWAGNDVWDAMPTERRQLTARGMMKVRSEFLAEMHSCEADVTSLRALARITQPVLYMTGSATKPAVHRLAEILGPALATAERVELHGLTHMGPVAAPEIVNREVERFLAAQ